MYVGDGPGKLPIIVKDLLRAQYIDAMLGLQGVPIVDVRTLSGDPVTLGPIDLIHWLCRRHPELTPDRMRELRLETIPRDLQYRLLNCYREWSVLESES